jgi:hypothetical protein
VSFEFLPKHVDKSPACGKTKNTTPHKVSLRGNGLAEQRLQRPSASTSHLPVNVNRRKPEETTDSTVRSPRVLQLFPALVVTIIKHWTEFKLVPEHYLFEYRSTPQSPDWTQLSDMWGKVEHTQSSNPKPRVHLGTPGRASTGFGKTVRGRRPASSLGILAMPNSLKKLFKKPTKQKYFLHFPPQCRRWPWGNLWVSSPCCSRHSPKVSQRLFTAIAFFFQNSECTDDPCTLVWSVNSFWLGPPDTAFRM